MSALLRIYDHVTSNNCVSLGISVASTAFMAYRTVTYKSGLGFSHIVYYTSLCFSISVCAGIAFALLAKVYLLHIERVKSEGERNSIYSTLSLFTVLALRLDYAHRSGGGGIIEIIYYSYSPYKVYALSSCFFNGFGIGFLATNLVLQLIEKSKKV